MEVSEEVLRRQWHKHLEARGVRALRLHDLRHTYARLLLAASAPGPCGARDALWLSALVRVLYRPDWPAKVTTYDTQIECYEARLRVMRSPWFRYQHQVELGFPPSPPVCVEEKTLPTGPDREPRQ